MGEFRKQWIVSGVIFALCAFCASTEEEFPVVHTKLGPIRGRFLESRLGAQFLSFRGIRYAEAPEGVLRFKPPVPVKPWNETFDATDDGPICVQYTTDPSINMVEDCLRLNVYTKSASSGRNRAVLIYFHPGGFYELSSQSKTVAGPEYLLDHDIVLVTANYRLGILGFLSTGTADAPGNNGLKDQVMVMKWVQENIEQFGGNPNSVTLMGYSAGAMSNTLHMVSPMSQGLFHRVIIMSGSASAQWSIPSDQLDLAKKQARLLNCSDESVKSIMECLQKATKEDFSKTVPDMFEFAVTNPIILFKPIVERDFGQERFLTEDPTCLFKSGKFPKIEILSGITQNEFLFPAINILNNDNYRQQMSTNFSKLAPICFLYERDSPNSEKISSNLKSYYFGDSNSSDWLTFDGLRKLSADGIIGYGMHRFMNLVNMHTTVYRYEFNYTGRYSHTLYPGDKPYGAVHHDDLLYLFRVPVMTPMFNKTDPENPIVENMTGWWTNFASTGNPNEGAFNSSVKWLPSTSEEAQYLEINETPAMNSRLFADRYSVWDNVFPIECSN